MGLYGLDAGARAHVRADEPEAELELVVEILLIAFMTRNNRIVVMKPLLVSHVARAYHIPHIAAR